MTELLTRSCDACGKPIGGGYKHCPKCDIYLCFMCKLTLARVTNEFPAKCPMCGGELSLLIGLLGLWTPNFKEKRG